MSSDVRETAPTSCPTCGRARPPVPEDGRCEPILCRAGTGTRWLALSAPESPLRIGVIGRSEQEARALYREREAWWLSDRVDSGGDEIP